MTDTRTAFYDRAFAPFVEYAGDEPDYGKMMEIANSAVPFGVFVGVRITELDSEHAVAEITDRPELRNHLRTVHAAALFLAADFSGAVAFVGAVASQVGLVEWLAVRDAKTTFLKPAVGRIRAVGTVNERDMRAILGRTDQRRFDVDGRSMLYDDNDVLVGKVSFDYVCQLAPVTTEA